MSSQNWQGFAVYWQKFFIYINKLGQFGEIQLKIVHKQIQYRQYRVHDTQRFVVIDYVFGLKRNSRLLLDKKI